MESDKPDTDDPSVPEVEIFHTDTDAVAMTVTELMDRIERTALKRYFAARECLWRSQAAKQTPTTG